MANSVKVPKSGFTVNPNVGILKYLRDLLGTGLYGNNYAQVTEELIRQRIGELIDSGKLKQHDITVAINPDDGEGD